MTRFALTLEWNGQPYMGFQRQAHGPSVQQAVEERPSRSPGRW
jgi:tRNA pseudouridine38-40 synthase